MDINKDGNDETVKEIKDRGHTKVYSYQYVLSLLTTSNPVKVLQKHCEGPTQLLNLYFVNCNIPTSTGLKRQALSQSFNFNPYQKA